jgi:hypothetical protein
MAWSWRTIHPRHLPRYSHASAYCFLLSLSLPLTSPRVVKARNRKDTRSQCKSQAPTARHPGHCSLRGRREHAKPSKAKQSVGVIRSRGDEGSICMFSKPGWGDGHSSCAPSLSPMPSSAFLCSPCSMALHGVAVGMAIGWLWRCGRETCLFSLTASV